MPSADHDCREGHSAWCVLGTTWLRYMTIYGCGTGHEDGGRTQVLIVTSGGWMWYWNYPKAEIVCSFLVFYSLGLQRMKNGARLHEWHINLMWTTSLQGNLQDGSELAQKMPVLVKLKSAIYSPEYQAFVECVTGLDPGTLTDEVRWTPYFHGYFSCVLCH